MTLSPVGATSSSVGGGSALGGTSTLRSMTWAALIVDMLEVRVTCEERGAVSRAEGRAGRAGGAWAAEEDEGLDVVGV